MINTIWKWKTTGAMALALTLLPVFGANEKNYTYLALGDSVAFGFDPTVPQPSPGKFIGYPERVAEFQSKKLANASCPGEGSGSFLAPFSPYAFDLGCNVPPPVPPGVEGPPAWKTSVGLHTNYQGSQMAFAQDQLLTNKQINLVTLSVGGNDLSTLQGVCANPDFVAFESCVRQQRDGFKEIYRTHLTQILTGIRNTANYKGTLVLLTYYSPRPEKVFIDTVTAFNEVMVEVGAGFDATIAHGFLAFQIASSFHNADPCAAGLLVRLSAESCDIHPSDKGRDLLAAAVLVAVNTKIKR